MKYTVIVSGKPYTVVADKHETFDRIGLVKFFDLNDKSLESTDVAEFNLQKIDGIIWEDNNASD